MPHDHGNLDVGKDLDNGLNGSSGLKRFVPSVQFKKRGKGVQNCKLCGLREDDTVEHMALRCTWPVMCRIRKQHKKMLGEQWREDDWRGMIGVTEG